ncbi:hypothetical protein ACIRG5_24145 [Lentzea sp. NPDC102401]|uniref:hypothetical protein n=1 Tax=Lentzea sp. NPDC102401 TaxID=3364128 RepID=UPI00380FB96A
MITGWRGGGSLRLHATPIIDGCVEERASGLGQLSPPSLVRLIEEELVDQVHLLGQPSA